MKYKKLKDGVYIDVETGEPQLLLKPGRMVPVGSYQGIATRAVQTHRKTSADRNTCDKCRHMYALSQSDHDAILAKWKAHKRAHRYSYRELGLSLSEKRDSATVRNVLLQHGLTWARPRNGFQNKNKFPWLTAEGAFRENRLVTRAVRWVRRMTIMRKAFTPAQLAAAVHLHPSQAAEFHKRLMPIVARHKNPAARKRT